MTARALSAIREHGKAPLKSVGCVQIIMYGHAAMTDTIL